MPDATVTRASIDWLTATMPINQKEGAEQQAQRYLNSLPDSADNGAGRPYPRNYNQAIRGPYTTISWHDEQPRMKLCANMTGDNCHTFYQTGGDMRQIIRFYWSDLANFTRIDFAVDWLRPASIAQLVDDIKHDPGCTVFRSMTPYQQVELERDGAMTFDTGVYLGSRKSDRYICVYDKAREQNLSGAEWTRIELRVRREFANQFAEVAMQQGITETGRQIIRDLAYPTTDWWQAALSGPVVDIPPVGRKETDTRTWLIDIVAPILQAELALVDNTSDPLFRTYNDLLNKARFDIHKNG